MRAPATRKIVYLSLAGLSGYLAYRQLRSSIIRSKIREGVGEGIEALGNVKDKLSEYLPSLKK